MESSGAGSLGSLRERNRRQLLDALRRKGSASRADLARMTGLSRSTVSTLVTDLQASGLVVERESDDRPSQQGRPPTLLALDQSAGLILGIDFNHEQVHVAIADLSRTILAERIQRLDVDNAALAALTAAVTLTDEAVAEAGLDADRILCAGVGLSGPIDRATGTVHAGKILPGWEGIRPVAELQARLDLPIHLDNDANLGALAEVTLGAGIGARDAIYLMVSGGIGAGLILNGEIYRGTGGTAGELGHVLVDESGPICRCGNRGCLETMAGAPAIIELLRRSHDDGLTLEDVIRLSADGDSGVRRAIGDAGRVLGRSVATMVNAFNPELIIVGGGMSAAGDVLLDPLREAVDRYAIPSAAEDVRITAGVLGERAEVLGALELAARQSDVPLPATSNQVA
ncbi:MAG TPA: ROK family transcriptional regulator [Solirubrobacteraceae bacterium]|jgi:predicted NBD/HSP70 family sugar kinase|nr:ROK family transcriptional regulator [Solirubrobacteraceae bacterium]